MHYVRCVDYKDDNRNYDNDDYYDGNDNKND